MTVKRKFNFALAILIRDGKAILNAAGKYATQLGVRLPSSRVTELQGYLATVTGSEAAQKEKKGEVGTLTQAQNDRLGELNRLVCSVREFAKRAFKGQLVKLHYKFQVGGDKSHSLGSIEEQAGIVLASCQQTDNAAALAGKGWLASDTQLLADTLGNTGTADDTQETGKSEAKGDTGAVNTTANNLYDGLLDIQVIADHVFPDTDPANITARADFKLDTFPPKDTGGNDKKPPA
jgi:hypothetical protein